MSPVNTSEAEAGILKLVCIVFAPFVSTARNIDITTIANGFSAASHATVIAVNPYPLVVFSDSVKVFPDTIITPTTPAIAPDINIVRSIILDTRIPA